MDGNAIWQGLDEVVRLSERKHALRCQGERGSAFQALFRTILQAAKDDNRPDVDDDPTLIHGTIPLSFIHTRTG